MRKIIPIAAAISFAFPAAAQEAPTESVDEAIGAQSSICGGGRYDYLAEEIGGP